MNRSAEGGWFAAPPTPPPPPDEWGGAGLAGLLSQADELLQQAEYDTDTLAAATETDGGGEGGGGNGLMDRMVSLFATEAVKETRRYLNRKHVKWDSNGMFYFCFEEVCFC